jgi:hypothetical protein
MLQHGVNRKREAHTMATTAAKPTAALAEHADGGPPFKGAHKTSEFRIRRPRRRSAPMVSVYDGQIFLGQIYDRGAAGYECFDRDGTSLGFFADQRGALDAFDPLMLGEDAPPF